MTPVTLDKPDIAALGPCGQGQFNRGLRGISTWDGGMMDNPNEELEMMIDKQGLRSVIEDVAAICREKAEHLRSNWQDETSAKYWEQDAKRLERAIA